MTLVTTTRNRAIDTRSRAIDMLIAHAAITSSVCDNDEDADWALRDAVAALNALGVSNAEIAQADDVCVFQHLLNSTLAPTP